MRTVQLVVRALPALLLLSVITYILIGMLPGYQRNPNLLVIFALSQAGIIGGTVAFSQAWRARRWLLSAAAVPAVLFVVLFMFLSFPMGVAECEEWIARDLGSKLETIPNRSP